MSYKSHFQFVCGIKTREPRHQEHARRVCVCVFMCVHVWISYMDLLEAMEPP